MLGLLDQKIVSEADESSRINRKGANFKQSFKYSAELRETTVEYLL